MDKNPHLILVDEQDTPIGTMEKLKAHQKGLLHRCFSLFIFNTQNEILIHKRALHKYHCGGLWTNTCCSHPEPGETTLEASHRRLKEEMGFDTELHPLFSFIYKAHFDNGITEHEFDHVFIGEYNDSFHLNPDEVADAQWVAIPTLQNHIQKHPDQYTIWFRLVLDLVIEHKKSSTKKIPHLGRLSL